MAHSVVRNRVFNLTITTRSPLHIGNGQEIVKDYDFVYDDKGSTAYVIDSDLVPVLVEQELLRRREQWQRKVKQYEAKPVRQQTDREEQELLTEGRQIREMQKQVMLGVPLDQLVAERLIGIKRHLQEQAEVEGQPLVRYMLKGDLSRSDTVRAQIKDAYGCPYLPGSSLKGGLRSVLAWQHFPNLKIAGGLNALRVRERMPNKEQADTIYDQELFLAKGQGNAANRDLLRGLHVGDSQAAKVENLILAPITVFGGRPPQPRSSGRSGDSGGFDVLNVEALDIGVTVSANLQIEQYPFVAPDAQRRLDFEGRDAWLADLAAACRARAQARITGELAYYKERGLSELERFYGTLRDELAGLGPQSFLLQLSWGGGWGSKTLDDRLQADEVGFAAMVREYNLNRAMRRDQNPFRVGGRFPITRKLVLNGGHPWRPLGWVRVDMEELS